MGIVGGFFLDLPLHIAFFSLLSGLILFLFAFLRAKKLLFPDAFFGSSTFLLFFLIGITVTTLHLPKNQPRHYLNQIPSEEISVLRFQIREVLKPDAYNNKFIAEVDVVNKESSHGKILLLQPKDSLKMPFLEGEEIVAAGIPEAIPPPLNPHQFNYARYLAFKDVHRQLYLRKGVYQRLRGEGSDLKIAAAKLRRAIVLSLQRKSFGSDELAIVQALLLGQKQDISAETYNNFAAAGAIHILAVSGLHVGIILLILNRIFAPLKRIKNGRFLKALLVIICLWGFALLAGLSPSVVRAVTMFSFIAIGLEINRRTATLNSVFLSLLVLLLIRPQWIFEVGFQLSYAAVISIVLFQPLFANIYQPSTTVSKYLWGLLTVTLAAQAGVFPLSLYYFHQFPGLFFLSNLIILPFLGIMLIAGVVLILLSLADALPLFLLQGYEFILQTLTRVVAFIAKQEQFLFKDIPFNIAEVTGWYLFIFGIYLLWRYFNFKNLILCLSTIIFLQVIYISEQTAEDRLIVFHQSRSTIIGKAAKQELRLHHSADSSITDLNLIKNYRIGEGFKKVKEEPLENVYIQNGNLLIILDKTTKIPDKVPPGSHLLLSGSPGINLERIIKEIKPAVVIADGTNYRTLVAQWKKTASKEGVAFHYTGQDGAYIPEKK